MPADHPLGALARYTDAREPALPGSAKALHRELRVMLVKASNKGIITTSPGEIERHVNILGPPPSVMRQLERLDLHRGAFSIFGGEKNQGRLEILPHFKRNDGAWFDFSITVRETEGSLRLLAYDFEIRLAPGMGAPFLRFDLNLPDHRNQARDLRCHLHPGSDDLLVPAPLMSPAELLGLFLDGVRLSTERRPRAPTDFEVGWLRQTLTRAAPEP